MRTENILEHFDIGKDLLSAIFLTYNFDIAFFVEEFLPILLDIETSPGQTAEFANELRSAMASREISVIVDMKDYVTEMIKIVDKAYRLPQTLNYHIYCSKSACFHPKVYLMTYRDGESPSARLIIGSANLESDGMRHNAETFSVFELNRSHTADRILFEGLYDFLTIVLSGLGGNKNGFRIMGHLRQIIDACKGGSESEIKFIHSIGAESILSQIENEIKGQQIKRIKIVSPFFEEDLPTVGNAKGTLFGRVFGVDGPACYPGIEAIEIYFSSRIRNGAYLSDLPLNILRSLSNDQLKRAGFFAVLDEEKGVKRFKHGKIFIIETLKERLILSGSANFSARAILAAGSAQTLRHVSSRSSKSGKGLTSSPLQKPWILTRLTIWRRSPDLTRS